MQYGDKQRKARKEDHSILLIEDDWGIQETVRLSLELEGYSVITASNGREGLDVLEKTPLPCLILLDLMMPVMDGWAVAEFLSKDKVLAKIPVVALTAYSEDAKKAPQFRSVLKKPVDLDSLYKTVKRYCAHTRKNELQHP